MVLDTFKSGISQVGRRAELRITLAFLLFGAAWVLLTDSLARRLVQDPAVLLRIHTVTSWAFVGLTALFIYALIVQRSSPLRRAEQTFRAVLDSIGDGVLLVGRDAAIVDANPAALRMLDVEDRAMLLGLHPEEFSRLFARKHLNGSSIAPEDHAAQHALRGETRPPSKATLRSLHGRPLTITESAAPVRDEPDAPVQAAVNVLHDITELDRIDRLRSEFFSAAAHAVKTPLATIKAHAQLLSRRARDEHARSASSAIQRQCARIDRLVQNLQTLARIQDGSLQLHPGEQDLLPLVVKVVASMRPASTEHGLRLLVEAQPCVYADPERLSLSLTNLVEIALRSAEPDSDVRVVLSSRDGHARMAVVYRPLTRGPAHLATKGTTQAAQRNVERWTGLTVGRHVSQYLIEAQGGALGHTHSELDTDWIELPALTHAVHDQA